MENQQNNALPTLRQEIDSIDIQIVALLEERMKIINRVSAFKKNNNEKFFIKSAREADMIKNLIKPDLAFPKATIAHIWRKIITAANMHEQALHIAIHNPKNLPDYDYLVKEYYSDIVPISNFDSATNVVAAIEKGDAQIGVFALPKNDSDNVGENWWISLANNRIGLKVFTKIPLLKKTADNKDSDNQELVAAAIKEPEESSSDNSLFYVELSNEISKSQLLSTLKEHQLNARILKSVKMPQVDSMIFYLLDIEGFIAENNPVMQKLKSTKIKPYIKVIGHYATPIII